VRLKSGKDPERLDRFLRWFVEVGALAVLAASVAVGLGTLAGVAALAFRWVVGP